MFQGSIFINCRSILQMNMILLMIFLTPFGESVNFFWSLPLFYIFLELIYTFTTRFALSPSVIPGTFVRTGIHGDI